MLYLEHAGAAPDEAIILPLDPRAGGAAPRARVWRGNTLHLDRTTLERFAGATLLINSGSLAGDLEALNPRNWMGGGVARLVEHLASLCGDLMQLGMRLLIEPCSRHVLHDAHTTAAFLREHREEHLGLALNPTALFEPSMMDHREDHLFRIAEALAPIASALILADAAPDASGENLDPADLGAGAFDPCETLRIVLEAMGAAEATTQAVAARSRRLDRAAGMPVVLRRAPSGALGASLISEVQRLLESPSVY